MTLKQSLAGAFAFFALTSFGQAADLQPVLRAPAAQSGQQATGYVEVYSGWASTRASETVCGDGCETFPFRTNGWALGGWVAPITGSAVT